MAQYCVPTGDCSGSHITNFSVTGDNGTAINNTTTCSPNGYGDFSAMKVTMSALGNYTITASLNVPASSSSGNLFIDWNNDSVFDETTELYTSLAAVGDLSFLVIPATGTTSGILRMRLATTGTISVGGVGGVGVGACGSDGAEYEDYSILYIALLDTVPACIDSTKAYPANGQSNVCPDFKFKWNKPANAKKYKFSLFDGTTAIIKDSLLTDSAFTPSTLTAGKTYRWIVVPTTGTQDGIACDTLTFTVTPNGSPKPSILPAHSNSICQNSTFILDGNPTLGTSPYTHSWNGAKNSRLSDTASVAPSYNTATIGTDKYYYYVTDANGCKGVDSVTINVTPQPKLGTFATKDVTICEGTSTELKVSNSTGIISWESSSSDLGPWNPVVLTNIKDTIYSTGILVNSTFFRHLNTIGTCVETSNPLQVEVIPTPAKPQLSSVPDSICKATTLFLTCLNYANGITWNNGESTASIQVKDSTFTYVATATVDGCTSNSDSITIVVVDFPKASTVKVINLANGAHFCDGDTAKVAVVRQAGDIDPVSWSNGMTGDTISIVADVTDLFETTANSFGCESVSDSVSIEFYAKPAKPIIAAGGATIFCQGDSVKLFAANSGGNMWSTNVTADTIIVKNSGKYFVTNTTYSLVAPANVDSVGCSTKSDTITVTIFNNPAKPLLSSKGPFCIGSTGLIISTGVGSKKWSDVTGSTTDTISVSTGGGYIVTLTDSNGCKSISDSIFVSFDSIPATPVISQSANDMSASTFATKYQWFDVNGAIPGATKQIYTGKKTGNYYVVAYSAQGCNSDTSAAFRFSGVGINEVKNSVSAIIYPNPSSGDFTLQVSLNEVNAIAILDISGRQVYSTTINTENHLVNSDLAKGSYVLQLIHNGATVGQKQIVIQ